MGDEEAIPTLTDEVPEEERDAEPEHRAIDPDGNPTEEADDAEA